VDLKLQKIGKGKMKVLLALFSLSIISSSFLIQKAYGSIKEDYECSTFDLGESLAYRFKVKVIIDSENDGTWIPNNWYRVDFIITLEYINHSSIESLIFYDPFLSDCSNRMHKNVTFVMEGSGQIDELYFEAASYRFNPRLITYPSLSFNITYPQSWGMSPAACGWGGREPIYIGKTSQAQALEPFLISIAIIGAVIGVGSVLLGIKIGEKRVEKKKKA
jgi:hypothetical protein